MSENVTASETISEWCAVENMSKAAFYALKRHNPDLVPNFSKSLARASCASLNCTTLGVRAWPRR